MHDRNHISTWVGAFVVLGVSALLMLAIQLSNVSVLSLGKTYPVTAYFENIGGLKEQSPVTMAGVVIGRVSNIKFDNNTYQARVVMQIQEQYDNIPLDTSANVYTSGLLGEQYIGLLAGGEQKFMRAGDEFKITQSAVVLEQLVGQLLINKVAQK